jgi:serine/threonine-protein kinase
MIGFFASRSRLADQLVKSGLLTRDQIRHAQEKASQADAGLCATLIRLGLMEESTLVHFIAERFDFPFVGRESLKADVSTVNRIPPELMRRRDLLPLAQMGSTLSVAMADPTDQVVIDELAKRTGLKIRPFLTPVSAISEVLERLEALDSFAHVPDKEFDPSRLAPFFEKLGDYRFERLIGSGGFGIVSQCRQLSLERPVAIKVLNPDWNRIAQVAERFRREGQIIAKLDHPNIIKVYEQGERSGVRYIVEEYFQGEPINQYLRERDWGRKLTVLLQVCSALRYAHDQGIIHRDIKPANILVNELGAVKLLDFGIAHYDAGPSDLTGPQVILGTPKYMAPELRSGADQASPASDLYAFGVMGYEILTGRSLQDSEVVHPSQADPRIPRFLGDAIIRCLQPNPIQRPQSFADLAGLFQRTMDQVVFGEAPREKRPNEKTPRRKEIQNLERLFRFKKVLRQESGVRTILAHSPNMGRDVVVKMMEAPRGAERLREYADLMEFHIGEIYGVGKQGNLVIVVTEYLSGGSLDARIGGDGSSLDIAKWLEGIIQALHRAEKATLTHGHLHPGNALFSSEGAVKVVDFGLMAGPRYEGDSQYILRRPDSSPGEQDRHALGAMAYEMITGERFRSEQSYKTHFDRLSASLKINPLLKYFLARFWAVKEQYPPYQSYEDMLADLERVRNRLMAQS